MPFDPNFPPTNAEVESAPFRNQFNALNDNTQTVAAELRGELADVAQSVGDRTTLDQVTDAITENAAGPCPMVMPLTISASDPPTQSEVQAVIEKFNELVSHLQRQ